MKKNRLLFGITSLLAVWVALLCATVSLRARAADSEPPIDPVRGRALMQKSQRGETLTAEEQAYLERVKQAIRERSGQKNAPTKKGGPQSATASRPVLASTNDWSALVPITDLTAPYKGEDGGLYGGGHNEPPAAHRAAHLKESEKIRPLDAGGAPSADGKIGLITIGFSNPSIESADFKRVADADSQKSPRVVIVNGCIGGRSAVMWAWDGADVLPKAEQERLDQEMDLLRMPKEKRKTAAGVAKDTWPTLAERIKDAGLSPKQVQVCWLKHVEANPKPLGEFPAHARTLQADITAVLQIARHHYPNLRIVYLSSRTFGGWSGRESGSPEPYAYESGFGTRWIVQSQIKGDAQLNYDPARGEVKAPLVLWGPYLWACGNLPRKLDGMTWTQNDVRPDQLHPNENGCQKTTTLLLNFFKTNEGTSRWFLKAAVAARGADDLPLAQLFFQPSMQAGFRDTNGNLVAGTEVMHLLPHKGRLYAGTSSWMEKDPSVPKACAVLALDSPKGQWRVERQFTRNNLRLGSLKTATFSTDAKGKRIDAASLLLATPDVARGPVEVFCRDDETGEWTASVLGSVTNYTTTRSIGFHRDSATGIDRVFAGTDHLGVIGGVYDPAAPGRIRWEKLPEFQTPPGERVMGFCNCNGTFYCSTSRHIYRRTDGSAPSWKEVYYCAKEISPCGIRGLSAVPNPAGAGEVLLFAALSKVRRLDPSDGFKETIELDTPAFLTQQLGVKIVFVLGAYNEFVPYTQPSGEKVWLFGFESTYPPPVVEAKPPPKLRLFVREPPKKSYFAAEARYCIRHAKGADIRYELAEVTDPRQPALVSVRVIAVSPFPEDRGQAFYFGGFDCNYVPSHNTAWIYRAGVRPP